MDLEVVLGTRKALVGSAVALLAENADIAELIQVGLNSPVDEQWLKCGRR